MCSYYAADVLQILLGVLGTHSERGNIRFTDLEYVSLASGIFALTNSFKGIWTAWTQLGAATDQGGARRRVQVRPAQRFLAFRAYMATLVPAPY